MSWDSSHRTDPSPELSLSTTVSLLGVEHRAHLHFCPWLSFGEWASSYHSVLNGVSSPKAREGLRRSAVCRTRWPTYWKKTFPSPLSLFLSLSIPRSCSPFPPSSLISSFSFFPALWFLSPTRLDSFCLSALTHALFVVWPRMFAEEIFHVCLLFNLTIQTHSCSNTVIKCQPVFNQTNYCLLLAVTSCVHILK